MPSSAAERPRVLLVPTMTEVEWAVRPLIERFAEVASYDAPGIGAEPPSDCPHLEGVARRGREELDRRGWERCVVVADDFGNLAALGIATSRPRALSGLVLGHACLEFRRSGDRPSLHPDVASAGERLSLLDYRAFVREDIGAWDPTKAGVERSPEVEQLVEEYLARVPAERWTTFIRELLAAEVGGPFSIEPVLRSLDVPLLLAGHHGCVLFTDEGFEDAVEAFPDARAVATPQGPNISMEFVEELREFCAEVPG